MKYSYRAIDSGGKGTTGEVVANVKADAIRQLEQQGLTPIKVEVVQIKVRNRGGRLKAEELNLSLFELAIMLEAGVGLAEAVAAQLHAEQHPVIYSAMQAIGDGLRHGQPFSSVLKASKLKLPKYVYQLVEAGEMTGELASALKDSVAQMEYETKMRAELNSALIYPSILVISGIAAVAIMFIFVVPNFTNLLDQSDKLPWLAWAVLSAGDWTNKNSLLFFGLVGTLGLIMAGLFGDKRIREQAFNNLLSIPVLGKWLLQADIAQWAKVLATLLGNKVALIDALALSRESCRLLKLRNLLEIVIKDVRGGVALSMSLEQRQGITSTGVNLIRVGEKTGNLSEMLNSLGMLYEEAGRSRMKKFLALIEPIAILTIGAVFGIIIAGVVLAITSANDLAI